MRSRSNLLQMLPYDTLPIGKIWPNIRKNVKPLLSRKEKHTASSDSTELKCMNDKHNKPPLQIWLRYVSLQDNVQGWRVTVPIKPIHG